MSIAINIACRFFKALILLILFTFIGEVPYINVVCTLATKLDSACLTKKVKRLLKILWEDIGCSFNGTNCSIVELHNCHTDILTFQIVMLLLTCDTIDFINFITHHPTEKIDSMDTLVHQRSTILSPGTAPRSLRIIILVTIPSDMD